MATRPQQPRMTVEEYFELCQHNPDQRYEYIDGYVVIMSEVNGSSYLWTKTKQTAC